MKDILRITIAQADLAWENPVKNRLDLGSMIRQINGQSDVVILPETFTTGFSMRARVLAEPMDGPTTKWLLQLSKETGIAIGGSLLIEDNGLYYNRFVFVTPAGVIASYNKRHLFSIGGESKFFTPGSTRCTVNYLGWRIALYVCYDIRFPVWCRNINDTDLMIFTANWPASRSEVWRVLLKARAIENQVYAVGVNRVGTDGEGISYLGESQVVSPRGELLIETDQPANGLFTYEISMSKLSDFRTKVPVANDADQFMIL